MIKHVIIYDDDNIEYFIGNAGEFSIQRGIEEITGITDLHRRFMPGVMRCEFVVDEASRHDTLKLDETLMKRIAKFNKQKECEKLDIKINEKKEEIKKLDSILTDRVKRVEKLKEFIKNIYEIDLYENDSEYYE